MALRRLDPEMIAKLHDVVERNISKTCARLEARWTNQVKEGMVESDPSLDKFHKRVREIFKPWSWSLPIRKRVVWPVRRLVRERRGHSKVELEVGFVDQCVEADAEPAEKLVDVSMELPNLVDAVIEIGFHDQLVESDMEIVEHLVVDNQVAKGDDPYVGDMDVVDMDVAGVDSLVVDVVEDLHDTTDLYVPDVDLLVVDMVEDLHVAPIVDLSLHVGDIDFMFEDIVFVSSDHLQRMLVRHYVQFVLGSEHVDWMVEILVVDRWMQIWMICMLVLLSLLEWKPLVKMKMVVDISSSIKV